MGAWGDGASQNDPASDWLATLKVTGIASLRSALPCLAGTSEDHQLDVDEGSVAVAAATVVASYRAAQPV